MGGCVVSQLNRAYFPPDRASRARLDASWIVNRRGQLIGPFSSIELALAAKDGLLGNDDYIWKAGLSDWFRAGDVEGLLTSRGPRSRSTVSERSYRNLTSFYSAAIPRAEHTKFEDRSPKRPEAAVARSNGIVAQAPVAQTQAAQFLSQSYDHDRRIRETALRIAEPATVAPSMMMMSAAPAAVAPAGEGSVTRKIADRIALEIILMLDRNEVRTLEDLASNARLRQLAGVTFDALPSAIRYSLSGTLGKPRVEEQIFDALVRLRATLLIPEYRSLDLRQIALKQVPTIALALDNAIAHAAAGVGSLIATNWTQVFSGIWGSQTQEDALRTPAIAGP